MSLFIHLIDFLLPHNNPFFIVGVLKTRQSTVSENKLFSLAQSIKLLFVPQPLIFWRLAYFKEVVEFFVLVQGLENLKFDSFGSLDD